MHRNMVYTVCGNEIVFDDYVDDTVKYHSYWVGTYWVGICTYCHNKYKNILGNRVDDYGNGFCSVKGCENETDYYVDFDLNEVEFTD